MSFGSQKSFDLEYQKSKWIGKCLGIISNVDKFKKMISKGIVVVLKLPSDETIDSIPFDYYQIKGSKKMIDILKDDKLLLSCEIGNSYE